MEIDQLVYSASMLQDYMDCQRRFELKYIRKQSWPSIPVEPVLEMEALVARGRQFHSLAHQFLAGLPLPAINDAINDPMLKKGFSRFVDFSYERSWILKLSEIKINANLERHHLIAVYDLIAQTDDGQVTIFDWKTAMHPPRKDFLKLKMQSSIYPFILFENLQGLFPSADQHQHCALSMTYWYPAYPDFIFSFNYDQETHQENRDSLISFLDAVDSRLQSMQFNKTDNLKQCKYCQYRSLCDRGIEAGTIDGLDGDSIADEIMIDFNALPEIDADI